MCCTYYCETSVNNDITCTKTSLIEPYLPANRIEDSRKMYLTYVLTR